MSKDLYEISGFKELQIKLQQVNDRVKKKEILSVLRKMARPYVRAGRSGDFVPVSKQPHLVSGKRTRKVIEPGNLRKSIGTITGKKGRSRVNPTIYVGPRAKGKYDGWYGHFVDEGTANGIEAQHFMKKIYSSQGDMDKKTADAVARHIQKVIDRLSK